MEYKIGDRVKIKSIDWYNANKDARHMVSPDSMTIPFTEHMIKYCGQVATITKVNNYRVYELDIPNQHFIWKDYMFENRICNYAYRVTEDINYNKKIIEYLESLGGVNTQKYEGYYNHTEPFYYFIDMHGTLIGATGKCINTNVYELKEFEEQNMMEERTIKLSLEKAKEWYNKGGELRQIALQAYKEEELTEFPKTWEECITKIKELEYIDANSNLLRASFVPKVSFIHKNDVPKSFGAPLLALCQLLICREVYRQGWKPDWGDGTCKSVIKYVDDELTIQTYKTIGTILAFQDEKTCNKFLKNFRDLIEEAKELI